MIFVRRVGQERRHRFGETEADDPPADLRRRKLQVLDPGYEVACGGPTGDDGASLGILPLPAVNGNGHHAANG